MNRIKCQIQKLYVPCGFTQKSVSRRLPGLIVRSEFFHFLFATMNVIKMENGKLLCNMCNIIGMVNRDLWDRMNPWVINLGEISSNKNRISFT